MELLKNTAELFWQAFMEAIAAFLVAIFLPALIDRAKSALGVVGGKLADFGWWKRGSVPAV